MSNYSIDAIGSNFSNIDDTQLYPLMSRRMDEQGNEYVYLKGLATTALGSWVTFDEEGVTTLLAANAIGQVAIAFGACVASKFGWYLIYGSGQGKVSVAFADNGNVYATATAGEVDDVIVAGDRVKCAIGRSAISGGMALMQINYPYMDDGLVS